MCFAKPVTHAACLCALQSHGRRLLQGQQNVAVNITVQAPAVNATDVVELLTNSTRDGSLQDAIAAAGGIAGFVA